MIVKLLSHGHGHGYRHGHGYGHGRVVRAFAFAGGLGVVFSLSLSKVHATTVEEDENNDRFSRTEVFDPEVRTVTGRLGSGDDFLNVRDPDITVTDSLSSGRVDSITRTGFIPGMPYVAIIDNTPFGGSFGPDTLLGSFTETGQFVGGDDNSSPLGNGGGSGLADIVNNDGSMRFRVTGFGDFDFDGEVDALGFPHLESGSYQLHVFLGETSVGALLRELGDIDYFTFTGLTPGSTFVAEVTEAQFDSTLFWLDGEGEIIEVDDDDGVGALSLIQAIVPQSGEVNLALSAYPDLNLGRDHIEDGDYVLTIEELAGLVLGDMDGNGVLDAFDVDDFEQALADPDAYAAAHPDLDAAQLGDFDESGTLDAFDVGGFETALAQGSPGATPVPEPASGVLALLGLSLLRRRR